MKISLSMDEVKQEINLATLLGYNPSKAEADAFFEIAKEVIIERTQSNKDINQKQFKDYSEGYANFKGVSVDEVDMTLFGDMLEAIDYDYSKGKFTLKIDDDNAVKAFAHMTGYEGHPTIENGPKRKFFGLTKSEATLIAEAIARSDDQGERTAADIVEQEDIRDIVRNLRLEAE
jgi:hypothetical protein